MSTQRHAGWSEAQFAQSLLTAREGSYSALGQLFDHYRDYLTRLAKQELDPKLWGKVAPSDVVQETFLEATRVFGQFDGRSDEELRGWLRQMLLNNLRDAYRRFTTQMRSVTLEVALEPGSNAAGELACPQPRPSSILVSAEERAKVQRALARLPADYRTVIELRNYSGFSFEEIGVQMDRSAEAVRRMWTRAIGRLTQELEAN